ncbi:hypothetical protein C8R47DRAFT_1135341 [Mycena vitilis]|nr:hypothetical protein C8R47DRAFT_1135341 [Mycena vitilis]
MGWPGDLQRQARVAQDARERVRAREAARRLAMQSPEQKRGSEITPGQLEPEGWSTLSSNDEDACIPQTAARGFGTASPGANSSYVHPEAFPWSKSSVSSAQVANYSVSSARVANNGLNNMKTGPWFIIHLNLALYVSARMTILGDGAVDKLFQFSRQWAQWDVLNSLANYRSVVNILVGFLEINVCLAAAFHCLDVSLHTI